MEDFGIPTKEDPTPSNHDCPNCEKVYGLHSDLYTDGTNEFCGYCGYNKKLEPKDAWL